MITDNGVAVPQDMEEALAADPEAQSIFAGLRHDDQLAYVNWLAKPAALSRGQRLAEIAVHVRNSKLQAKFH